MNSNQFSYLPEISTSSLNLNQKLSGISFREKGQILVDGQILEKGRINCEYILNHNGARGFSGTGLFTNGKVAAVYTGWHKFDHFVEEFSSVQYFQKQSLLDCEDGIDEECLESIAMYVGTLARNPRTRIFDVSCFFSLKDKMINIENPKICK